MGFFDIFRAKDNTPRWTVAIDDIRDLGVNDLGLYAYSVTWRKGPQTLTGTYAFPTPKSLAKVLSLAKAEC